MLTEHEIEFRVRYYETDAQGRVHHGTYVDYFETGRVELMRASGRTYRELEDQGLMLVVTELSVKYFLPADYDDLLRLKTTTVKTKGARATHEYELFRGEEKLVEGRTVVGCLGPGGKPQRLPDWMMK